MRPRLLSIALLAATACPEARAELIWIEGEDAEAASMRRHGWYDSVKKDELSGGEWLSHFAGGEAPVARYTFAAEAAGPHRFWLRANPVGSALSARLGGGEWRTVPTRKSEQQINIASDGKPDLRFVAWIDAGELELKAGENTLELRFDSDNNRHGGVDCFVLASDGFLPQGARKPGEKTGLADPGHWAFEPDADTFSPEALLDLSALNEKPAGKHGRVRRSPDGADFVDGAGEPLRFWAVNTGVQNARDMDRLDRHARWLAKRGVNMVRHHGHLAPGRGSALDEANRTDIERAWALVAAMKEHGIYTTYSPYWASHTKVEPGWGLADAGNGNLTGLLFFDTQLQAAYKAWLRALLTPPNPHTGVPLAEDPALAVFQIQNEDSLLFWTEGSIKGEQRRALGRLFAAWLVGKYGSLDEAVDAWGGAARNEGDDFAAGLAMPHIIWHLTQDARGPLEKRLNDQLAFYAETMRAFNTEIARFLREELGYKGLVNAGNWRTADAAKLFDAERYAYAANDVIGVNRYYNGGGHENPREKGRAGYAIDVGDRFDSRSALLQPWAFPLALRQVHGHPMIISESSWVPPLRYQSEGSFLVAAYGALTGFDIFYWFATGDTGFGPPMGKWQISSPSQMGKLPAAALMFRRGDVARAREPAVLERRLPEEVFSRAAPLLPEEAGFDPNRDDRAPATTAEAAAHGSVTPLAYLVGPVEVGFDQTAPETRVADLSKHIDTATQTVTSSTGQLRWNYGDGFCTLEAPRAAGACGNLEAAGGLKLGALALKSDNDYATVLAVSLDGAPLASAKRVLVQVGTVARPYGWKTEAAPGGGLEITDLGGSPWNVADTKLELQLANPGLTAATLLDANGLAVRELEVSGAGTALRLTLPAEAMYVVLR